MIETLNSNCVCPANMRTPGGGFAPVLTPPSGGLMQLAAGLDGMGLVDAEALGEADPALL